MEWVLVLGAVVGGARLWWVFDDHGWQRAADAVVAAVLVVLSGVIVQQLGLVLGFATVAGLMLGACIPRALAWLAGTDRR